MTDEQTRDELAKKHLPLGDCEFCDENESSFKQGWDARAKHIQAKQDASIDIDHAAVSDRSAYVCSRHGEVDYGHACSAESDSQKITTNVVKQDEFAQGEGTNSANNHDHGDKSEFDEAAAEIKIESVLSEWYFPKAEVREQVFMVAEELMRWQHSQSAGRIAELEAQIKIAREGLNKIASWDQGPLVNSKFDEPSSTLNARETVFKMDEVTSDR